MLKLSYVPMSAKILLQKLDVNFVFLEDTISLGNPCNLIFPKEILAISAIL